MRYLTLTEVLFLHRLVVENSGGSFGVRDFGMLQAALAQPKATFEGKELYPSLLEKASCLCFSLVSNHPFLDGNKRIGHAAMVAFLKLNGFRIDADIDESEALFLGLAGGLVSRAELLRWVSKRVTKIS